MSEGIDLTGGHRIDFGDRTELNGLDRFAMLIGVSRSVTGWFSAARTLVARSVSGKRQVGVAVRPLGGLGAVSFGVAPGPTAGLTNWYVPDVVPGAIPFQGRTTYLLAFYFRQGQARAWVNGVEATLTQTDGPLPPALTSPIGVPLTVGGVDLLQANVFQHAWWWGADLPDDPIVWRSLWAQDCAADLSLGIVPGHDGSLVAIPQPKLYWPMSGDVLPVVTPKVGTLFGTVIPGPGAKTTRVPRPPVRPPDDAAEYRFEISDGYEQHLKPYAGSPGLVLDGADLWLSWARGVEHLAPSTDTIAARSRDLGRTWPRKGLVWPGDREVEELAFDADDTASCRGSRFVALPGGRLLQLMVYRLMDLAQNPYRSIKARHTDDRGKTWSPWRETLAAGTRFTSMGGGGSILVLPDGAIQLGAYRRDNVIGSAPPLEQAWYDAFFLKSMDHGLTWQVGPTIASGAPNLQWEEPIVGVLQSGKWLALLRRDSPAPAGIYRSESADGVAWSEPVWVADGYNTPVWIQLPGGTILMTTRRLSDGHGVLRWSIDEGTTWSAGVDLVSPVTRVAFQAGASMTLLPDGVVCLAQSHEIDGFTSRTLLEVLRLKPLWAAP